MTGLMQGKRGLIMGLANDRSLAWGIAQKLREQSIRHHRAATKGNPNNPNYWDRYCRHYFLRAEVQKVREAHNDVIPTLDEMLKGWPESWRINLDAAEFLAGISPLIPWHLIAFHGDYRMAARPSTTRAALEHAARIGETAGLKYVYVGNVPGGTREHTRCHQCGALLVEHRGFEVLDNHLAPTGGRCPRCGTHIPGIWV